jgi:hypothetical protein
MEQPAFRPPIQGPAQVHSKPRGFVRDEFVVRYPTAERFTFVELPIKFESREAAAEFAELMPIVSGYQGTDPVQARFAALAARLMKSAKTIKLC